MTSVVYGWFFQATCRRLSSRLVSPAGFHTRWGSFCSSPVTHINAAAYFIDMKIKYQGNFFFQTWNKIILPSWYFCSLFQYLLWGCLESVLLRSPIQNRLSDFVYYLQTWLWMKMFLSTMICESPLYFLAIGRKQLDQYHHQHQWSISGISLSRMLGNHMCFKFQFFFRFWNGCIDVVSKLPYA